MIPSDAQSTVSAALSSVVVVVGIVDVVVGSALCATTAVFRSCNAAVVAAMIGCADVALLLEVIVKLVPFVL